MELSRQEILETIHMSQVANLDIRTVTLGISLFDCVSDDPQRLIEMVAAKIRRCAGGLVGVAKEVEDELGIPIVNKRVALTPLSLIVGAHKPYVYVELARAIDSVGAEIGVDFIGGYSVLAHKGTTKIEEVFIETIPDAISTTRRLCSSVSVASTKSGINMDAVLKMAYIIKKTAELTSKENGVGCGKLVVFANIPEDNPFMAGAFHGVGEPETAINVGISGPGVILESIKMIGNRADLGILAETVKRTAFKITRAGELVGRLISARLGVRFGIVDISLAPTPAPGDSVAEVLEAMGLEKTGTHGTTAALALLNDAVKKGGAMACGYVGGMSGAFIPVSEDSGMVRASESGALTLSKLEAMTAVCSVGLDMVAIPGDTPPETIAAIIADEMAIGVYNNKSTAVRILPIPGKKAGEKAELGGLLGTAFVQEVNKFKSDIFVLRGGRIPPPISSLTN